MSVRVSLLAWAWVFLCAIVAFALFGPDRVLEDTYGSLVAQPFGGVGEATLGVWARWDSVHYLDIANHGYDLDGNNPAFFPLYPLAAALLASMGGVLDPAPEAVLVAGLAVSLASLVGALYFLHRLVELELDAEVATLSVVLVAFFPTAFFFESIYSESLFLLCSVGAVWFARTERWALAGLLGGAAAATRSPGIVILLPLALIYLLGPRGTPEPRRGRRTHPIRADALWLLLVPAGLAAYAAYLGIAEGDPLRFRDAQDFWNRSFGELAGVPAGPLAGLWEGTRDAVEGVHDAVRGKDDLALWAPHDGGSLRRAGINVEAFAFLCAALAALVGTLRRLPLPYGAYALVALALPLSYPRENLPLFSMPRFVLVIFPLFIWLALAIRERGWQRPAVAVSALLLALYTAQWATWQWVA